MRSDKRQCFDCMTTYMTTGNHDRGNSISTIHLIGNGLSNFELTLVTLGIKSRECDRFGEKIERKDVRENKR